ncbi:hypothetical protein Unana1_08004 [Umbelopsis nana]
MKFLSLVALSSLAVSVYANGPAAGCLQTYTVQNGDGCEGIAASFSLTPDDFYNMNPGLHHAGTHLCDNLDTGKPYCVCMKKPCAQQKNVVASGSVSAGASAPLSSAAASGSSAASSLPASVASSAIPTGALSANATGSAAASGSAASASGSATAAPKSAGEKLVSSVAMVALLAGAASVLAL